MTIQEQEILDILSNKIYRVVKCKFCAEATLWKTSRKPKFISPLLEYDEAKSFLYNIVEHAKPQDEGCFFYVSHYKTPYVSVDGCRTHVIDNFAYTKTII